MMFNWIILEDGWIELYALGPKRLLYVERRRAASGKKQKFMKLSLNVGLSLRLSFHAIGK